MRTRSKIKFRIQIIPEIEDWILPKKVDPSIKQKIIGLSDSEFQKIAAEVLHYGVTRTILREINSALEVRARHYLSMLEKDIRKLSRVRGAFAVDETRLDRILKTNAKAIVAEVEKLWTTPNVLWFDNYKYRETFNLITEYAQMDPKGAKRLRQEITAGFYDATDDVKKLFKLRFQNKEFQNKFWDFIAREILGDVELSNFLRAGKTSKGDMDPRNFDKTKDRFRKRHNS